MITRTYQENIPQNFKLIGGNPVKLRMFTVLIFSIPVVNMEST